MSLRKPLLINTVIVKETGTKSSTIKQTPRKSKKNTKKIARTRRQRGYHWEDTLVKRFNELLEWKAFRLGSPSTSLPDILAVSSSNSTIFTIEAKSGTTNSLVVPSDQIERCLRWINTFELYKTREVVFAFKFLSKKRIGLGEYESRQLREFYKVWNKKERMVDCICTYEGQTFALENGKRSQLDLKDYSMPFKSRHVMLKE